MAARLALSFLCHKKEYIRIDNGLTKDLHNFYKYIFLSEPEFTRFKDFPEKTRTPIYKSFTKSSGILIHIYSLKNRRTHIGTQFSKTVLVAGILLFFAIISLHAQEPAPMWVQDGWRSGHYPNSEWYTGFARDKTKESPNKAKFKEMEKTAQNSLSESITVTVQGSSATQISSKQSQKGETINRNYEQNIRTSSNAVLAKMETYSYFDKASGYIYGFAAVKKKDLADFYSAKINGLFSFAENEFSLASQLAEAGKKKSALNKMKAIEDSLLKVNYWENLLQTVTANSGATVHSHSAEILQKINTTKIALEYGTSIYLSVSGSEYVAGELPAIMQEKGCNCSISETAAEADYAITVKAKFNRCNKADFEQVYCWANASVSVFNSKTKKNISLKIPQAKGGWTEGNTEKATEESFKNLTENLAQQLIKEMEK